MIINGDCMDNLDKIRPGTVDLLLTDPPYGISRENNYGTMTSANRQGVDFGDWDKNCDITGWIRTAAKTLRENANVVIFNCWENLGAIKRECDQNHITIKRVLVISKRNPAPFNRDRMFANAAEFALWGVYNTKDRPTGWTFNREEPVEKNVIPATVQPAKYHPTAKDLTVIEKLVRTLSKPDDLILDPFMGSGTTGVACQKLGRRFIGIEIDEKYYATAKKRIEEAK